MKSYAAHGFLAFLFFQFLLFLILAWLWLLALLIAKPFAGFCCFASHFHRPACAIIVVCWQSAQFNVCKICCCFCIGFALSPSLPFLFAEMMFLSPPSLPLSFSPATRCTRSHSAHACNRFVISSACFSFEYFLASRL